MNQALKPKKSSLRIIETEKDVRTGLRALVKVCPHMRKAHALAGEPPLRRTAGGFEGLARIVVGQQVSVASAAAIWGRFHAAVQPFEARRVARLTDAKMQEVGLSRPKIKTLRAVAAEVGNGLDLDRLSHVDDDAVRTRLTAISGIGPWTSDVFLLFCLGRADAFAPGDLALQEAARMVMDGKERPTAQQLQEMSERWRPWRGVAARLLWAYYKAAKDTKSGTPL